MQAGLLLLGETLSDDWDEAHTYMYEYIYEYIYV